MDRGAWQATVHGVTKSQTRVSDEHLATNQKQSVHLHKATYSDF